MAELGRDRKQKLLTRLEELENDRKPWEPLWRDLSRFFLPTRSRFLNSGERTNQGDKRNRLESGVGVKALENLAAIMQSGLTSPSNPWFKLEPEDSALANIPAVKAWIYFVQTEMYNVFRRSNFYDQIHLVYAELGAFGTGAMMVEDDPISVLRCRALTAGEYCIGTNSSGRVDSIYRRIRMTARQIVESWPDDAPSWVKSMADSNNEEWQELIHAVEPNPDHAEGSNNKLKRAYSSIYMMQNGEVLEVSGYYEFPALCPRWNTTASDVYGYSPAVNALPDCRQLQKMIHDGRLALELEVRPPMAAAGLQRQADLSPGALNPVSTLAQGNYGIKPLYEVRANFAALAQEKAQIQQNIEKALFNDLILLVSAKDKTMTAYEASIINNEKLLLLGPVIDRLSSELYQPGVERTFGIMSRQGMIPPPPEELAGQPIKIEFVSILSLGQRQAGKTGILETAEVVGKLAQLTQSMDVIDKFNADNAIDEMPAKKKYVRLSYTLTGAVTGLTIWAGITRDHFAPYEAGLYIDKGKVIG